MSVSEISADVTHAIVNIDRLLNEALMNYVEMRNCLLRAKHELLEMHEVFNRQKIRENSEIRFTTITTGEIE